MKRFVIIPLLLLVLPVMLHAQQADSLRFAALGQKLSEYYNAMLGESPQVQQQECDFLIESTSDSLLRQFVALDIFSHYLESKVMGAENVAVHVFDKWFATGAVRMKSEADFFAAKVYADFNRMSLTGKKAQVLELENMNGEIVQVPGKGRYALLFFYDTDCAKCKVESILLRNFLSVHDYPVDVYAVYTGDDRKSWEDFVAGKLNIDKASHLWDPSLKSDFQRRYGVLQTPRMLLIDPEGIIIGRGLDVDALASLMDAIFAEKVLDYGSRESERLFDGIFAASAGKPKAGEVKGIADYIHDKTLKQGDTLMFRQLSGDYLYYLSAHSGEGIKEGLGYLIDKNILSRSDVWRSADDSLKVVGMAQILEDLLSRAKPGTKVPSIKVPGELLDSKGSKETAVRLDKLKGRKNIIFFYTQGCQVCAAQKAAALRLLSAADDQTLSQSARKDARDTRVFMVNVDKLMADNPSLANSLMDSFDLSSLPFIIMTDRSGVILRRYVSLTD